MCLIHIFYVILHAKYKLIRKDNGKRIKRINEKS